MGSSRVKESAATAIYQAELAEGRAKRALVHYFKMAIPGLDGDCLGEVEAIAEDIAEAATKRAFAAIYTDLQDAVLRAQRNERAKTRTRAYAAGRGGLPKGKPAKKTAKRAARGGK